MVENYANAFAGNWTGTATISGSGDAEQVTLCSGEYLDSEVVDTGSNTVRLQANKYAAGDTVTIQYRTAVSYAACLAAAWSPYTTPFTSLGYSQARILNPA